MKSLLVMLVVLMASCKKEVEQTFVKVTHNGAAVEMGYAQAIYYKSNDSYIVEFYDKDPTSKGFGCEAFKKMYTEGGSNPEGLLMYRLSTKNGKVNMIANGSNHVYRDFGKVTNAGKAEGENVGVTFSFTSQQTESANSDWKGSGSGNLNAKICVVM